MEKKVIDISTYQTINDVDKLKANCDGVIVRVGFTGYAYGVPAEDSKFLQHMEKLKSVEIDVGAYYFTLASNTDMVDKETDWLINKLAAQEADGFRFTYPIYVDCEKLNKGTYGTRFSNLDYATRSNLMKRWMQNMEKAGYKTGIYAGVRGYHRTPYFVSKEILKDYDKWTAQYNSVCQWDGKPGIDYHMWQYSSQASFNADSTASKYGLSGTNVDVNKCYVDYPSIIKDLGLNHIAKTVASEPAKEDNIILRMTVNGVTDSFTLGKEDKIVIERA